MDRPGAAEEPETSLGQSGSRARAYRAANCAIDVLIVMAAAVAPEHQGVPFRREQVACPLHEVDEGLGAPRVEIAVEALDPVRRKIRTLPQPVPVARGSGGVVGLDEEMDRVGGTHRLDLREILGNGVLNAVGVTVVSRHVDEDRPLGRFRQGGEGFEHLEPAVRIGRVSAQGRATSLSFVRSGGLRSSPVPATAPPPGPSGQARACGLMVWYLLPAALVFAQAIVDVPALGMDLLPVFFEETQLAFAVMIPQAVEPILSQGIAHRIEHTPGIHVGKSNIGSLDSPDCRRWRRARRW